jgi:hypothetical protein
MQNVERKEPCYVLKTKPSARQIVRTTNVFVIGQTNFINRLDNGGEEKVLL